MVVSAQADEALAVIERQAARLRAPLSIHGQDFLCRAERGRIVYEDQSGLLDLPLPRLPGRHQLVNAGTAIAALAAMPPDLPLAAYESGIAKASWPGRLQNLSRGRLAALAPAGAEIWLDGGHNEAGGRVLAEAMADFEEKTPRPLVLLYGCLQTKDAAGFPAPFRRAGREVVALPVRGEQIGRAPEEIAAIGPRAGPQGAAPPRDRRRLCGISRGATGRRRRAY